VNVIIGIKMIPIKGISEKTIIMEDKVVAMLLKRIFACHG
jgi:hypothetical protein